MEPLEAELCQLDAEYARLELEAAQPVTTRDYVKRADIAPFPGKGLISARLPLSIADEPPS